MYLKIPYRFVSATAAGALALSVLFSPYKISADPEETTENNHSAESSVIYTDEPENDFFDVCEDDWFYKYVIRLAEHKVISGFSDGGFYPNRHITRAEFLKMLVIAVGGYVPNLHEDRFAEGHWASEYIDYAIHAGILSESDTENGFEPDIPILRADMADFAARALGIEPDSTFAPFPDTQDPYAASLYREYILIGVPFGDGQRLYNGNAVSTRAEAAALVLRMMDYKSDPDGYKTEMLLSAASQYELRYDFELSDIFRTLNRELIGDFIIKTPYSYDGWIEIYRDTNVKHLEDFYASYLNCEYTKNSNTYKLHLEFELDRDVLIDIRDKAESAADMAVAAVVADGMSESDKIRAIHDHIVLNCEYDYKNYFAGTIPFDSRLAYGALCAKSAVCQGYTAAFNMMARRAGIISEVVTGKAPGSDDTHAWNRVICDGAVYYVDVTHDDPVPDRSGVVSYKHFMLTEDEMINLGYLWQRNINSDNAQIKIHD